MGTVDQTTIRFYRVKDPYGCFSNFAPAKIRVDDIEWPTTEHYFQAQKFEDAAYRERIRTTVSPMEAAELGRSRKVPLRRDWEGVKNDIMRQALRAKFTQHADLREILLGTGDAMLIEHTHNDRYWADGGDGNGRNMLGILLMELRAELQGEAEKP